MNRRSFLKWLGIGVPAAVVAEVVFVPLLGTSVPKKGTQGESFKQFSARLGEWHNYYSEGDPEIMDAIETWRKNDGDLYFDKNLVSTLKHKDSLFEALASRRTIPMNSGMKREFFRYES